MEERKNTHTQNTADSGTIVVLENKRGEVGSTSRSEGNFVSGSSTAYISRKHSELLDATRNFLTAIGTHRRHSEIYLDGVRNFSTVVGNP